MPDDQFADAPLLYSVRTRRVGGLTTALLFDREGTARASICERADRATWEVRRSDGSSAKRRYRSLPAAVAAVTEELGLTEVRDA